MEKEEYIKARQLEKQVIEACMQRWRNNMTWHLELGSFEEDMSGIDAKGYIQTKNGKYPVLVQIKNISFVKKLPIRKQQRYLEKVSENMTKLDPAADQRLICYELSKTGKMWRLYNYNLRKRLD